MTEPFWRSETSSLPAISTKSESKRRLAEQYGDHPLRIPMRAHVMTAIKAGKPDTSA
jgi:hypothetical protein